MICKASIVSAIYVVKFQKNAELFLAKKGPPSANAEFFCLPQMRKKKIEKKIVGSKAQTRHLNLAVHHSNHYSIPPSLESELKIECVKKLNKT